MKKMRLMTLAALLAAPAAAQHDHGAHGGHGAPPTATAAETDEPTPAERKKLRAAVVAYIAEQTDAGAFVIEDEKEGKQRRLKPTRLDTRMSRSSETLYKVCADFAEESGSSTVDVDFLVNRSDSGWEVRQALVHQVDRQSRPAKAAAAPPLKKREAAASYSCPMGHYSADQPGKCPKCGMDLQKQ